LEKSGTPKQSPVTITTKGKEELVIHNHSLLHISDNSNKKSNQCNIILTKKKRCNIKIAYKKMEFGILLGYITWSHRWLPTLCRNLLPPSDGQKIEPSAAGSPQYQLPHYMMPSPL
jgi:hypothetical protein